jgi:hypothetical protein
MNDFQIQTGRYQDGFRRLAGAMRKNSVRQHEFATLLRLLSSRFGPGSAERRMLRQASTTARCKEDKLRKLLVNLGWSARVKRPRTLRFLTCFQLTKSAPVPLTILLLTFVTAKPVRSRILDPFYPWKSTQSAKGWTRSLPRPVPRTRAKLDLSRRSEAKAESPHSH